MKKKLFLFLFLIFTFIYISFNKSVFASDQIPGTEEMLEAKVVKILEEKEIKPQGSEIWQTYQKLQLLITKGSLKDKKITVENGHIPLANVIIYQTGDNVLVSYNKTSSGNDIFYITDFVRRKSLLWLFFLFVIFIIAIARFRGIASILGMGISFFVIFSFILPKISSGENPVKIAVLGSLIIIPISFFLSHGINKKTVAAILGTVIALIITGFMATFFVDWTRLSGFASEEASFLQVFKDGNINMKGLLLAGIIIGVLGVLDDITISQSAIVSQLNIANPKLTFKQLYTQAMNIGQDHIASMVNTLVLVYTGAALPLLILFTDKSRSFSEVVNYEIVADEIVRTLVGSIGLILAVPITTLIAVYLVLKKI